MLKLKFKQKFTLQKKGGIKQKRKNNLKFKGGNVRGLSASKRVGGLNQTTRKFSSAMQFNKITMAPPDPIFSVGLKFKQSKSPNKINVGVGAYRDDEGKPVVLKSVAKAQELLFNEKLNNEYGPIEGTAEYIKKARELAFGINTPILKDNIIAGVQSISGTGALRLAGEFINTFNGNDKSPTMYCSTPTWGNHIPIFQNSGLKVEGYRYYDKETRGLDINGFLEDINNAPNNSVFCLHACAHNPTGVDPTQEQWQQISKEILNKGHLVLFDSAYQGFASGCPDTDNFSLKQFINDGHKHILLSQSFAKNFGLYGQRTGALHVVCENPNEASFVQSRLKGVARAMYSNPPIHGARIVEKILTSDELTKQWKTDVKEMADRIISTREQLVSGLEKAGSKHDWSHVTSQIGMFCFTGMTPEQVAEIEKKHIFMTTNGRISMAGVTSKNVDYLAQSIHEVTK